MSNRHFYLLFLFAAIFGLVVVVVVFHFNNILRLLWLVVESCLLLLCFWLVLLSPQPRDFPFKHFDTVVTLGYQSLFLSHFSTLLTSLISHSACEDDTPWFNSSHQTCAEMSPNLKYFYCMFTCSLSGLLTPTEPGRHWVKRVTRAQVESDSEQTTPHTGLTPANRDVSHFSQPRTTNYMERSIQNT